MPEQPLSGKVAIVTGGSRGIGKAIALAFADAGADVAVIGRAQAPVAEVAAAIERAGRRGRALVADLTDVSKIPGLYDEVESALGAIDIVVINHGVQITGPAEEITEAMWDETIDTNLKSLFFCCQAAGRHFFARQKRGKIINIGSTFALVGFPEFSAYCASKGGVLQLTKVLAAEWAARGVNVNAIGPTAVYTDMMRTMLDDPDFRAAYLPKLPSRTFPSPEDIAAAAVFLAGPGADQIHGTQLMVDGGFTAI